MNVVDGRIVSITPEEKAALLSELEKTREHYKAATDRANADDAHYYLGAESVLLWLTKMPVVAA